RRARRAERAAPLARGRVLAARRGRARRGTGHGIRRGAGAVSERTIVTASWPSPLRIVADQARYQVLLFFRSPVGLFFTILLPSIMLVLFNALFGDGTVDTAAGSWSVQQFYTG